MNPLQPEAVVVPVDFSEESLAAVDVALELPGNAKVFVNGTHVPYTDDAGKTNEFAAGYCKPFSFDVTDAVKASADNQITIKTTRTFINELGTGGLLAPVTLYAEK